MNDFNYSVQDLAQYASGYITYGNPVEAEFASGSITFGTPIKAEFASIQISVVDYTQLVGKTVTIDGQVLTEGVDFTAATDNNTTGTSLAAAIDALANWTATGPGMVVAKWNVRGTVGNGKSVTTNASGGLDIAGGGVGGGVTTGGLNGDTVAVGGTTFTAVQSAPGANEFTDIAGLEALVEAVANINSSQNGTVVSITYATRGVAGNAVTLVLGGANAGTMAVSGATLTGGVNGDTVTVNGQLMTAVASAPGANEFSNITELEALIEALASINSSQDGTTVTINADAPGTAGNAITLALGGSNAGTMAISGATLTGGVASSTTDKFLVDMKEAEVLKVFLTITSITSGAIVTVTPQTSFDGEDWQDLTPMVLTSAVDQQAEVSGLLDWARFKVVVSAGSSVSPEVTLRIHGVPGVTSESQGVVGAISLLTAQLFNNVTTAANSEAVDVSQYDNFLLFLDMQKANTPTNLTLQVQFSDDGGTTWYDYDQGLFSSLIYNQAQMSARIYKCFSGKCMGKLMRLRATASGTTASATFTLTAKAMLKN